MSITQTIEVPNSRRVILDVPKEVPTGRTIITFTPAAFSSMPAKETQDQRSSSAPLPGGNARTMEEAIQLAEAIAADTNRKPFSRHFGVLKGVWEEDALAYQRAIRDEWN